SLLKGYVDLVPQHGGILRLDLVKKRRRSARDNARLGNIHVGEVSRDRRQTVELACRGRVNVEKAAYIDYTERTWSAFGISRKVRRMFTFIRHNDPGAIGTECHRVRM